jgi:hypothetical protein
MQVELEALDPPDLHQLFEDALEPFWDVSTFEDALEPFWDVSTFEDAQAHEAEGREALELAAEGLET